MSRVKRGVTTHARHARLLAQAKGFYGRRKNTFRAARQAVDRSQQYAYHGRRLRKRDFRSLWIQRVNAGARMCGTTYAPLMCGLRQANIHINRKILADISANDAVQFAKLVKIAQESLKAVSVKASS